MDEDGISEETRPATLTLVKKCSALHEPLHGRARYDRPESDGHNGRRARRNRSLGDYRAFSRIVSILVAASLSDSWTKCA